MPLEYYSIPDRVDALAEAMSTVVSDKATVGGSGFALLTDIFALFAAYGGMEVRSTAITPPTAALGAGVPAIIAGWEQQITANKNVTVDLVNGKNTVDKTGLYRVDLDISIEHNVTTTMLVEIIKNGTTVIGETVIGFRANQSDIQDASVGHIESLVATDFLEVRWTSVVGGTATVLAGDFYVQRIINE